VVAPADQKPPATPAAKPFNFERMKDEDLHEHRSLKQREE